MKKLILLLSVLSCVEMRAMSFWQRLSKYYKKEKLQRPKSESSIYKQMIDVLWKDLNADYNNGVKFSIKEAYGYILKNDHEKIKKIPSEDLIKAEIEFRQVQNHIDPTMHFLYASAFKCNSNKRSMLDLAIDLEKNRYLGNQN